MLTAAAYILAHPRTCTCGYSDICVAMCAHMHALQLCIAIHSFIDCTFLVVYVDCTPPVMYINVHSYICCVFLAVHITCTFLVHITSTFLGTNMCRALFRPGPRCLHVYTHTTFTIAIVYTLRAAGYTHLCILRLYRVCVLHWEP